jgi:hypothetical protein
MPEVNMSILKKYIVVGSIGSPEEGVEIWNFFA